MNPSNRVADSRERSRQLALRLAPFVNLTGRPVLTIAAGTTLMWAGEKVTRMAFLDTGHVDGVLHLQGADGGLVIPITFGDGELIADATAQQILMTFDRWPAERAAIEAMAGGARQAREA